MSDSTQTITEMYKYSIMKASIKKQESGLSSSKTHHHPAQAESETEKKFSMVEIVI